MNQVYTIITNRIIEQIEKNPGKWAAGWKFNHNQNLISRKPYRGVNTLLTALSADENGYKSPYWLTVKQALSKGGRIKADQWRKSTLAIFYTKWTPRGQPEDEEEEKMVLRFYKIYNLDQCEGIEAPIVETPANLDPIASAEKIVKEYPNSPRIEYGGGRAYYSPPSDYVKVPALDQYQNPAEYYSVLFHELTHSTGHESRLNRFKPGEVHLFGDEAYSKEELIAELGATFLCNEAGIENSKAFNNSAAYLNHWLGVLKKDHTLIVSAAGKAQSAVDYILARKEA